jgi:uncharacterized membrane protein YcaP (DUF421 family)
MLFVIRVMGKRQLGEMQPFEFAITLLIAEVAAIPLNDPHIPLHFGLIPMFVLVIVHVLMSVLARRSILLRHILSGKSILVVDKGVINYGNLLRMNMNMDDLLEAIRCENNHDMLEIEYAIFETNGQICIVNKPKEAGQIQESLLPIPVVIDGKWIAEGAAKVGTTHNQVQHALSQKGVFGLRQVALVDIRQNGVMYICTKHNKSWQHKLSITGKW